ncbi:MAG TPA: hypothetical protein PLL09_08335 [Flavobacterium sp.]|uniref:hypothetical protein n=1 Tax=unclassified Flavobacterium TaxID=196869 RepID=UPI000E94A2E1|nr:MULTISPECIES: hypothetical protein [unclassified Flavobacterium]HBI00419.1 hypothetical protein [Flavobacterium sp.]HRE77818.1 hypothetical protein [Flavobacterium sp.]
MELKVNQEQIDRLYRFTREHFVEHYDLQTELVDHLSNAIEEEWKENPKLSFEEALQKEFKKFGVFGFMDVVEKRQSALSKKYHLLIWKHFKEFFTIPKIIITISFVVGLFYFFKYIFFYELMGIGMILWFVLLIAALVYEKRKMKKRKNQTGKKWMFEEIIYGYGSFSGVFALPLHLINVFSNHGNGLPNDYVLFGISFFLVSVFLATFIVTKIIPSKAEEYLKQTYPEYAFSN